MKCSFEMSRNHVAKRELYTETAIALAIKEVNDGGYVRKLGVKYHLPRTLVAICCQEEEGK